MCEDGCDTTTWPGVRFGIYAREHMKVKCANDKTISVYVTREDGEWKVGFIGCC
jgi:hypothetical protein